MAVPTRTRSSYPVPVPDLLPRARALAEDIGEIPSRNTLMKELRIGPPKARELRALLINDTPDQTQEPDPDPVEDTDHQADTDEDTPAPDESPEPQATADVSPDIPADTEDVDEPAPAPAPTRRAAPRWPLLLLAAPAMVAIWAGWVDLGRLTGFGRVRLLPGIADAVVLDTAITLPVGMETYAAYALWVWLSGRGGTRARAWARWSAIGSLMVGAAGQVAYHLMSAAGWTSAPWPVTAVVACLPVAVLGMGAALAHLLHAEEAS